MITAQTLITRDQIQDRVSLMGNAIASVYDSRFTMLVVLKGAAVFSADLLRAIKGPCVDIEYVRCSSYDGEQSSGEVVIEPSLDAFERCRGQDVLIVEDIVDTGLTLRVLQDELVNYKPRSIRVASLLFKPSHYQQTVPLDFIGFTLVDEFAVGYGMDNDENWRELDEIAVVSREEQ